MSEEAIQQRIAEISEEGEIWKPCPEFEEKYLISSHGRVMGIGTYNTCKKGELLKLHKKHGRNGYIQARFYDRGRAKTIEIHSLVAKAFIPNPNNLPMVNHINEDKTDNNVENLEWCTLKYNIRYSDAKPVDVYTKDGLFIESLETIVDTSNKYNVSKTAISRCCRSKDGITRGYQFRYKGHPFIPKPIKVPTIRKKKIHHGLKPKSAYYIAVDEYSIDGVLIKTWPSISSIVKEYGIPSTNISKCCKGNIKTINGHVFVRHGEDFSSRLVEIQQRKHKSKSENVR